jgi:glyoxylase-like metal-dependent hydrolase (beta-lactamase superfamily II)
MFGYGDQADTPTLESCTQNGVPYLPFGSLGYGATDMPPAEQGQTAAQARLAWLLARSPVTVVIAGTSSGGEHRGRGSVSGWDRRRLQRLAHSPHTLNCSRTVSTSEDPLTSLIVPGVHRLGDDTVSFYLIEDDQELLLVDAGLPRHFSQLTQLLERLGRSLPDIKAVLLTHGHVDHLGIAERVRRQSGAPLWVHPADAAALKRPTRPAPGAEPEGSMGRYLLRRPAAAGLAWHIMRSGALSTSPVLSFEALPSGSGQTLDLPGRPRLVAVPGHTPGSVALHLPSRAVVLTGDALVTSDGLAGRTGPSIVNAGFTHDTAQALKSLEALAGLDAEVVLPGHGEPFTAGVTEAVRLARLAGPA